MNYHRWTLMDKNKSMADKQYSELKRLLHTNDDLDDDEALIPVNRSRLVKLDSLDSEIDEESDDAYEYEEDVVSDNEEDDLLLQLLLEKRKESMRNSGKFKRPLVVAKRKRVYDDLREKLNDIRDQQEPLIDNNYGRKRSMNGNVENKGNNRYSNQRNNRFSEQGGRQGRYMEQKDQRNFNDQRGNNRFFEKRGGNRRFTEQRGRQKSFNDQSRPRNFTDQRGRNRYNGQDRRQWSNAEKGNAQEEEAEEKDKEENNDEVGKPEEAEDQAGKNLKEPNEEVEDYAMETAPSELETLMGFGGFQSSKQPSN